MARADKQWAGSRGPARPRPETTPGAAVAGLHAVPGVAVEAPRLALAPPVAGPGAVGNQLLIC